MRSSTRPSTPSRPPTSGRPPLIFRGRAPRHRQALETRRQRAAQLFRRGQRQAEVARLVGVARQTVSRWYHLWRRGGRPALRQAPRTGRPPRLTTVQVRQIQRSLLQGARAHGYPTELWTLRRIADVIARCSGVRYHPGHVWRLLHAMGWSRQRPARRAAERDEGKVQLWLNERWPELKKTPNGGGPGWFSLTKAASPSSPQSGRPGRPKARRRSSSTASGTGPGSRRRPRSATGGTGSGPGSTSTPN